jgi:NAD(P)-dependent dehydrogenase (short-subunit alcohol dehydrogenase family)
MSLRNRVVLLTGASRGLGAAYVRAFATAGAIVVATARSFNDAAQSSEPADDDGQVVRWHCDVGDEGEIQSVVARTMAEFGQVDVLVNNAGVYPHYDTLNVPSAAWDDMMRVNVRGAYLMMREVVPHMRERRSGAVVTLSSGSALHTVRGSPGHDGLFPYGVSKAAIDRMTDYLGEELAPDGVAVNALRPGGVLTGGWQAADPAAYADAVRTGRGQPCSPEVVGPPMLFLAEQTPDTMTGRVVNAREFRVTWPVARSGRG